MLATSMLLALALGSMRGVAASDYYTGDGTAYTLGAPSNGNCNLMTSLSIASTHYAALNNEQWGNLEHCGRCAEVSCADARCADQSKTEVVQILDRCPECKHGDLDLSPTIFTSLTGSSPSRYTIKWRFVDCPVSGNIQYCLKEGSNPYWIAIQPDNVVSGVKSLTINGQSGKQLGSAYYYLLDSGGASAADLSAVRTTIQSINGESITETVSMRVGQCTEGQHQFARGLGGGSSSSTSTSTSAPATNAPTSTTKAATAAPATTAAPPKVESTRTPAANKTTTEAGVTDSSVASDADAASNSGASSATKDKSLNMNNAAGSDEANVLGTVAPASSTAASAATEAPTSSSSGVSEVSTRTDASTTSTSPVIIVLSCFGVVAAVVLIAMVVVSRRNQLAEEDKEDYIDEFMRQGSSLASAEGIVTIQHGVL